MPLAVTSTTSGGGSALPRGHDASYDAGTTADYFVDGSVGSSGAGTSLGTAFKTVSEAVTQVISDGGNKTIAIVDNTYREALPTISVNGVTLKGYGTDKPTITGQEALTGWTQCTASDSTELGSTLGITNSPVYKVTMNNSSMAVDGSALNLFENGVPVPISQIQTGDKFFFAYDEDFDRADSFTLNGSNQITAIVDTAVASGLTSGQATNAFVYLYHNPNSVSKVNVTSFSGSTFSVDGSKVVQGNTPTPAADDLRWNLANCLPKLTAGTYGYIDNGDGTSTIYCYPTTASNITSNMSYSARTNIITLSGSASSFVLEGLHLTGVAGTTDTTGNIIKKSTASTKSTGIEIRHCRIGDTYNSDGFAYGAVWLPYTDDCVIERNTIENVAGAFGMFMQGGTGLLASDNNQVIQNVGTKIACSPFRFYTQTNCQFIRNTMTNTGKGGHTNAFNFYEQCDTILVYGNKVRGCIGYATFQEASATFFGFNDIQAGPDDSRAIEDQQNATAPPTNPTVHWYWNNHLPPNGLFSDFTGQQGLSADEDYGPAHLINNITYGGGIKTNPNQATTQEGNIYTHLTVNMQNTTPYFWTAQASETVETTIANVYTDAANNDFTTASASSPILTASGVSLSTVIAAAQTAFPSFDFTKDADGYSFTTTSPAPGPYQNDWDTQVA